MKNKQREPLPMQRRHDIDWLRNRGIFAVVPVSHRENFRRMGSVLCEKRCGKLGVKLVYRADKLLVYAASVLAGRFG